MSRPLHLLLVEDCDADAELIVAELRAHGYAPACQRVQTEPDFLAHLDSRPWEVIIADYRLPRFGAMRALEIVQGRRVDLPFIIVSGTIGEEVAVAAMKAGAHDYVMKGKLARLVPAVERELREAEVRRARARVEQEVRFQAHLLQAVGQAVLATDAAGRISYWNRAAEQLYGWPAGEAQGRELEALVPAQEASAQSAAAADPEGRRNWSGERVLRRRDGSLLTALVTNAPVVGTKGEITGMIQVSTDVTERKLAELQLQDSREQLRALAARLQSVREEERKGLSRDIHDELGQVLTGLKMELAWMRARLSGSEPVPREALLEKIALLGSLIDTSAGSIRRLCAELRPGILDDLGLAAAIEWQAHEFSRRTGIKCRVSSQPKDLCLDPEASTAVFRIFQEILTNVARHARASRVTAHLTQDESAFALEAKDDGCGIPPERLSGVNSLGLLGMRERAAALGGRIEFRGRKGGGTTVTLSVPCVPAGAAPASKLAPATGKAPGRKR